MCVFCVKCGDLCGIEGAVAQGADWHSDAGCKWRNRMSNIGIPGLVIVLAILVYFGFTILNLVKKRKDGVVRFKMAISMFIFGALSALLMIFGFIEYSNASRLGADSVANAISTQIAIGFFVSAYMVVGGIFLMRKTR